MERLFTALILSPALIALISSGRAQEPSAAQPAVNHSSDNGALSALPPLPKGRSTIIGGAIRNVDPVLDRFTLHVYGQKPMKILYDERTQVFRDGVRIPLRELQPCDHASVQTTLDGTDVFAISIHVLAIQPQGDYDGQVISYHPESGELNLAPAAGGQPFKLHVSKEASFSGEGQGESASPLSPADLQRGTLVAVTFTPDARGEGIAKHITILATPGSQLIFEGSIASLDMHSGTLVVVDPRDDKRYEISFRPENLPRSAGLHVGEHVSVTAQYDGRLYVATQIAPY